MGSDFQNLLQIISTDGQMNATIAATILCLCTQLAAAQGVAASAAGGTPVRGTDLIKTAAASPQRDVAGARAMAPHEPAAAAGTVPAESPRSDDSGLLLAGLALMAGIALRRYSAGPR